MGAEFVIDVVASEYGLNTSLIKSKNRTAEVAEARQVVMLILHDCMGYSTNKIAQVLSRSHPTVIHGIRRIKELASVDKATQRHIGAIKTEIETLTIAKIQ